MITANKTLHALLFTFVMFSYVLSGMNAYAADVDEMSWTSALVPTEVRALAGVGDFSDVRMAAFAYQLPITRRFRIDRFELATGVISADQKDRLFVSLGPVWHFPIGNGRTFAEFGLSPTIIGGSTFGDRKLGGNFHFTSSITLGAKFGARENFSIALRGQHTSNGGIHNENPGLDLFGLNFSFQFGQ